MIKNQGHGKRLNGNKVKVRCYGNGQFNLTIPRAFALNYELKHGSIVEASLTSEGILLKKGEDSHE